MLIYQPPSNGFNNEEALKSAEKVYKIDLLETYTKIKEKAIIWKARLT